MLRYDRQTKPGLVALYDIRPGNGAGPFLQPRSPHGAGIWNGSFSKVNQFLHVPQSTDKQKFINIH